MKAYGTTRRDFLQKMGVASGSSLLFGAMDALELMGAPAGPRRTLPRSPREARVLVLGAGLSGLAVSHELTKLGHDVRILEARGRVGGVAQSVRRGTETVETTGERQVCTFDEGLYLNAGPWRIPNSHTAVLGYCKELGVPLQIFVNEHDDAILYYEGEQYGALSGRRVHLREVKADMRGHTSELLAKAVRAESLDLPLTAEDVDRLVSYLTTEGYLTAPDLAYAGGRARGGDAPYDLPTLLRAGFASRVRAVAAPGNTRPPMFQPVGGMDQIPMAFARALGERITLNAEVESIRQTESEARVVYRDTRTGVRSEVAADYVVCCIPLTVLSQTVDVPLSSDMLAAVTGVTYSTSAKIGIQTRRRFWEEDDGIYGGATYTNLPLGQFAYPSNDYFSSKGVLLGFYGNGTIANLQDRPASERIQHVVDTASRFHPQLPKEFETGYAAFWTRTPYSLGAYASSPGSLLSTLSRPEGRLYLGCAAVGTNPAWMEGAFGAAWGVVERLHERALAAG